jgi:hypothetical protein
VVGSLVGRDESAHGLVHDSALGALERGEQARHHAAAGTGNAVCLAQRPPRVTGELERVDAGHRVEGGVAERQELYITLLQVDVGKPVPGDLEKAGADVQAAGDGPRSLASMRVRPEP